jgi:ParB family transcriptional regulator, chromosome partitioning protein
MTRKTGLGKGLDALIPVDELNTSGESIQNISTDNIIPNPRQPRSEMPTDELQDLASSIREHGILQPLIVTSGDEPGQYILIAGERRLRASRLIGLATVPVIVREVSDLQRLELALIENIQREDLSPLETAHAFQQLSDEFHLTHDEIAQKVGKSRVSVTNTLRLLKLPEKVQEALRSGLISEGHARTLLALPNMQGQLAALQTILIKELNVRQTEQLIQKMAGHKESTPKKPVYYAQVKQIEENLRDILGTKVTLHYTPKGGSLVIHYYSDEELDSIIHKISNG